MKKKFLTGITMGEPAGISSEITLKVWMKYKKKIDPFIFFGDPDYLLKTSKKLKYKVPIKIIKEINESYDVFNKYLPVYKVKLNKKVQFGSPNIANASSILSSIKKTVQFALKKKISSIVTNPIDKNCIEKKKKNFNGHTYYIAKLLNLKNPIMFLTSPKISVVPITQHLSMKNALKSIKKKKNSLYNFNNK